MGIFLDSGVIIAYVHKADVHHARASTIIGDVTSGKYGTAWINDYIFNECISVIQKKCEFGQAVRVGTFLLNSELSLLRVNETNLSSAWKIYCAAKGKMSFTDSLTVSMVNTFNLAYIASFDRDLIRRAPAIAVA